MIENLLSFASYLMLTEKDASLQALAEKLGAKLRLRKSDQLGFLTLKKAGVEFRFHLESWLKDDPGPLKGPYVLTEVGAFADGCDGHKQFAGELFKKVTFDSTREDVRKAMGKPVKSGGGTSFGALRFPEWDRFLVKRKYYVEFSFRPEDLRIREVSINIRRVTDRLDRDKS